MAGESGNHVTPWRPGPALAIADAFNPAGESVDVSPRRILADYVECLAVYGCAALCRSISTTSPAFCLSSNPAMPSAGRSAGR